MKCQQEPFSECENIVLEAKRVLLNEQLDQIANMTLSEDLIIVDNFLANKVYASKEYYENLTSLSGISINTEHLNSKSPFSIENTKNAHTYKEDRENDNNIQLILMIPNKTILKKYFKKWRMKTQAKVGKCPDQERTEKLNEFMTSLKNYKCEQPPDSASKQIRSSEDPKPLGCFKNRYRTQKCIIDLQKSKIEEQTKIINELKLGIIREDLLKSIDNTKIEIREIFNNCSAKLLCSAPLLKAVEEREQMMIQSQKAPKTVQKMQQRAIERAKYREIILERKKLIEEARQKLLEEAIEKKTALEEEERKRNLEIINEQRKKELYLQRVRHEKRQEFERKLSMAVNYYNQLLKRQCFKKLFVHYKRSKENSTLATEYYLHKQKHRTFKTWLALVEATYQIKYHIADAHFGFKALTNAFNKLKEFKLESVRSMQVAEDLYDFRLTSNTFIHWHRFVCRQVMLDSKQMQFVIQHNNRRLLFQYFYQWKSLPVVIQLEKTKEEKKRRWREKVWEIVPDYRPPEQL